MKVSDNLLFYTYNNPYSPKKVANMNQNQFNQNVVSNNLSTNNTNGSVAKVTLYKDAVLSTHNASGASAHVFYDEESGLYKVKGNEADGTAYETLVDITKVDPSNASRVDMIALATLLGKGGDKSAESFLLSSRREMDNYFSLSQNEQRDFNWNSMLKKENQYDDLNYIAQGFYKAGAMDGYVTVSKLIQNIKYQVKSF